MKKRVLKATSFQAESLLKGLVLPDNVTQVIGIMSSGTLGKVDVLLVQEYDVPEEATTDDTASPTQRAVDNSQAHGRLG